jgi:dinuclear metal center YbgI/SA1388 family protein
MAQLDDIMNYGNTLLNVGDFKDYCPNGLQVDAGGNKVQRLATAVTASQAVIEMAKDWQADLLLVHHGFFWKGETAPLTGIKGQRIRTLMTSGIHLIAYHLPLDAHPMLGNNSRFGELLGLQGQAVDTSGLLWMADLEQPRQPDELAHQLENLLGRVPQVIPASDNIERLAWCTGAAQDAIEEAARHGAQGFISGEISERTYHLAQELGLSYFAAGHHATERLGVQALGHHLAEHFGLDWCFFDQANPI